MAKEWCDHCGRFCKPRLEPGAAEASSCPLCGKILRDKTIRGDAAVKLGKAELNRKFKNSIKEAKTAFSFFDSSFESD